MNNNIKNKDLPRIIWIFWHEGWKKAPLIAKKCLDSWRMHNPTWTIYPLDQNSIANFIDLHTLIPGIENKEIPWEAKSDIIRVALLAKYGGIWVDSTLYCNQPLDNWIYEASSSGFFAFSKPGGGRMLSSWFLCSYRSSLIIDLWLQKALEYWNSRTSRHDYFWFHGLFEEVYNSNKLFKKHWDKVKFVSAELPHYFFPYQENFEKLLTHEEQNIIDHPPTPVFKLTHKYDFSKILEKSVLTYLLSSTDFQQNIIRKMLSSFKRKPIKNDISIHRKMQILVCWYGSFGHGTIGDLFSAQVITNFLQQNDYNFHQCSFKDFFGIVGKNVDLEKCNSDNYDVFIFVCGPIMKEHPNLGDLFLKFKNCITIGIGVSLFEKNHFNFFNPFDHYFAREGGECNYDDVALLAPKYPKTISKRKNNELIIGVSLRGKQAEYGIENCLDELADSSILKAAQTIAENNKGRVIFIENHLIRAKMEPDKIDAAYAQCDLVITTRLHGSMISLKHSVPFIAIDQIKGGAKLWNILGDKKWPYVYKIEDIDGYEQIIEIANKILNSDFYNQFQDFKSECQDGARNTLITFDKCLKSLLQMNSGEAGATGLK